MEGLADFMSHYASNINFEFDWKQIVIKNTCQSDFLKEMFKKIINFNN